MEEGNESTLPLWVRQHAIVTQLGPSISANCSAVATNQIKVLIRREVTSSSHAVPRTTWWATLPPHSYPSPSFEWSWLDEVAFWLGPATCWPRSGISLCLCSFMSMLVTLLSCSFLYVMWTSVLQADVGCPAVEGRAAANNSFWCQLVCRFFSLVTVIFFYFHPLFLLSVSRNLSKDSHLC